MMDEKSFLTFVYDYVKKNPGIAVALQAYAREAIEGRLREAYQQCSDTEAAFILHLGRAKPKREALEKLKKWQGRLAFAWPLQDCGVRDGWPETKP
jgi:hypothetical protein